MATVHQEIEQRVRAFEDAFNRGDLAALADLYTEDATVLPPDSAPVSGRQAIQRFWQGIQDSGFRQAALRVRQVQADGDLAVEVGTAELIGGGGDAQSSTVPVQYVVAWRRGAGGPWQLAVDIWNSRPAE